MRLRAAVAIACAACLLVAPPATAQEPSPPPYSWNERADAASAYAKHRRGRVAFAVVDPRGRVRGRNVHERRAAASVVKAMLLVAYLNHGDLPRRDLRAGDRALLRPMILRSGNREATSVRNVVGNASLAKLARRARMKDFAVSARSWGSTQISAYDQARFFWRVHAYVPRRHRAYALSLLGGIVDRHRWGIPPALPAGWEIFFKGGWHEPHRVNQAALLRRGRERIGVAVLVDGNPSFAYGQATITGVSQRLLAQIP